MTKRIATKSKTPGLGPNLFQMTKNPDHIVRQSDSWVIIRDRFPKAMFHWLILPKESIPRWANLNSMHIPLLRSMHEAAEQLVSENEPHSFQIGYHAVPSMLQLHMHVISTDFCSPCLKTKKHWNSFTTRFFIPSSKFIKMVENGTHLQLDRIEYLELLKSDLKCHLCQSCFKTMPNLKTHLEKHRND
ncbi:Aprataxin [Fasciola hepatica]|uniref:Aprataxin n=1 Tax=Fasciola hepatica TaxID=6192 RepID=A0A4E0RBL2_FASHE|nr:Aprataxin [Fasciola hepatica]